MGEAAYCDEVAVVAEGRLLMVETPAGLRHRAFGGDMVDLATTIPVAPEQLAGLPFVRSASMIDNNPLTLRLVVEADETAVLHLQRWFEGREARLESALAYVPPFDDVFVKIVEESRRDLNERVDRANRAS